MIQSGVYHASAAPTAKPPLDSYLPVYKQNNMETDPAGAADFERILNSPAPPAHAARAANTAAAPEAEEHSFLSFIKGIIDIINPLQHIPVVSAIYRHLTGDEISPMARIAGDTLYGGPVGAAVAVADVAFQKITGKDTGETVIAGLTKDKAAPMPDTLIAQQLNNEIAPAAGEALDANDIIWSIPYPAQISSTTTSSPLSRAFARTNGEETAAPPVLSALPQKGSVPDSRPLTALRAGPTTSLQAQEARGDAARTAASPEPTVVPKEQIASKMMEALDKYAEMKRQPVVVLGNY